MTGSNCIKVGDFVRFNYGGEKLNGLVKEDRGPIGKSGRHLYSIRFEPEANEFSIIELPANEFELIRDIMTMG